MNSRKLLRAFIFILCGLAILSLLIYGLYRTRTARISRPSPDGRYIITADWFDAGGWGYSGKIYVKENSAFGAKKYTGHNVPATYEWIDEDSFYIDGPGINDRIELKIEDFFR